MSPLNNQSLIIAIARIKNQYLLSILSLIARLGVQNVSSRTGSCPSLIKDENSCTDLAAPRTVCAVRIALSIAAGSSSLQALRLSRTAHFPSF